ncbi:ethylene-responsive transcription factor-like protein At4g13040 isoform X1 [Cryptomeria japonica]|uniref:ethylene-responsive transcription factor-like protein At4g13040 isoform X1 n=1 Tax=Cryptomeria japonica TaxID=3369 RepID=UPI0025AC0665|nr:ethylene-responsive transcription factor-like protein At4g13040 isoform X1 [Cryptomeria japonica]XP_057870958.1 ethylene-responsive transcription factor-like protein At4g13040 isoform X1 [Cryptomeria japonica]XP_057870959.1 ethylene-responsive transcription factor-like protein At4g13040 isoform X1 [Cryptomeria japonica]
MVSIRRRKLLGLSPGTNAYLVQVVRLNENGEVAEHSNENPKPHSATTQSMFSFDFSRQKQVLEPSLGSSNVSGCSSSKEHKLQSSGHEMKRRKRQRRKQFDNQEPCLMRGVYFKNMKWQAAIKVEKKQIHLGTVGSQEEAAHLYDRAAFMCGREPNFELSEEEKQELRKFNWEEFLELTRNAITNKRGYGGGEKPPKKDRTPKKTCGGGPKLNLGGEKRKGANEEEQRKEKTLDQANQRDKDKNTMDDIEQDVDPMEVHDIGNPS